MLGPLEALCLKGTFTVQMRRHLPHAENVPASQTVTQVRRGAALESGFGR